MVLKTQPSTLISIDDLDHAKGKLDVRFKSEDPNSEDMQQLISSIKEFGILNPLHIRPKGKGRYDVISGNRRLSAAKALRLKEVPATILNYDVATSRLIGFHDNAMRLDMNVIPKAKNIIASYENAEVSKHDAIRMVRYMATLQDRHKDEYDRLLSESDCDIAISQINNNKDIDNNRPTKGFLKVFKKLSYSGMSQYQLLRTIIKIPERTLDILETAPKLGQDKAVILAHSRLDKYPEVVREELAKQVVDDPKMNASEVRHLVDQTVADLEEGRITVSEDGSSINYGYSDGKGNRSDPEENVATPQELESFTFYTKLGDINHILMTDIGKILKIKIGTGQIHYEPSQYKPALEELQKNLGTLTREQKEFCAENAAIMERICKTIVDSVR